MCDTAWHQLWLLSWRWWGPCVGGGWEWSVVPGPSNQGTCVGWWWGGWGIGRWRVDTRGQPCTGSIATFLRVLSVTRTPSTLQHSLFRLYFIGSTNNESFYSSHTLRLLFVMTSLFFPHILHMKKVIKSLIGNKRAGPKYPGCVIAGLSLYRIISWQAPGFLSQRTTWTAGHRGWHPSCVTQIPDPMPAIYKSKLRMSACDERCDTG